MPFLGSNLSLRKWKDRFTGSNQKSDGPIATTRGSSAPPELESGSTRTDGDFPTVERTSEGAPAQSHENSGAEVQHEGVQMPVSESLNAQMSAPMQMPIPDTGLSVDSRGASNSTPGLSDIPSANGNGPAEVASLDPIQNLVSTGTVTRILTGPPPVNKRGSAFNKIGMQSLLYCFPWNDVSALR